MNPHHAVMISCVQRREERALSLASLAAQGVHPLVIESECDPPSQRNNRATSTRALATAPPDTPVLFCEDDIRANHNLPAFLQVAHELDEVMLMCNVRDLTYEPRTQKLMALKKPLEPRIERVSRTNHWSGTQCVFLPARIVSILLDPPPEAARAAYEPIDIYLGHVIRALNLPFLNAVPNPVQHTAAPKLVRGTPRVRPVSPSFDLSPPERIRPEDIRRR